MLQNCPIKTDGIACIFPSEIICALTAVQGFKLFLISDYKVFCQLLMLHIIASFSLHQPHCLIHDKDFRLRGMEISPNLPGAFFLPVIIENQILFRPGGGSAKKPRFLPGTLCHGQELFPVIRQLQKRIHIPAHEGIFPPAQHFFRVRPVYPGALPASRRFPGRLCRFFSGIGF
jgi:hypothetical protein